MTAESTDAISRSDLNAWLTPKRFAVLLGLLICVTYPEVILGSATFFHRDFATFGYPLAAYQRACFWRGELPFWTPLSYCGVPFLAQWNTMTLYPLSLFYLLLPLSWSLGVFCLGHLFFAGLGMYFLARRWTGNQLAASVAGLAFTFNAVLLHSLMWPNNMAGFAWLPWVVIAVERAWREGGRRIVLATLAGAMQMLSGAPEVILLTWLFLGALWLLEWWRERELRWRMLLRFVGIVALVAGLTAVQLLPFLDLLRASQRHAGFSDSIWAMPVWGWANFLVPLFRARPTLLGIYSQPEQFWIQSYYLGAGVIWLAVLAVWKVRRPRVWLLALVTLGCLLVALGDRGLVYAALRRLMPGLGFMRFPIKFVILPTFLLPLLAAYFVAHCRMAGERDWPHLRRDMVLCALALLVGIVGISVAAFQFPLVDTSAVVALKSGVTRVAVLALFLAALFGFHAKKARLKALATFGLVGLIWADMITSGPRPNPTAPPWIYEPGLAARESGMDPVPHVGDGRPMLSAETQRNVNVIQFTNATDTVMYSRLAMFGNLNLLDNLPKVVGSYSLYFRELGDVLEVLYGTAEPPPGLLDFLSVSQVNAPGKATQWSARPSHLPWITSGQKPVFADHTTTLHRLGSRDFDPRREVYLSPEIRDTVTVTNESGANISVQEFASHRLRVRAEAAAPALLVFSQSFSRNWHATVDGQPATLLRANHAFQAVEVPAGNHEITLKYEDRAFQLGAGVSLLTLLGCVGIWWRCGKV